MEKEIKKKGKKLGSCSAEELDQAWEKVKTKKTKTHSRAKKTRNITSKKA